MSQNEYESILVKQKSLIQDEYYFKYIFKKTEKIICAVFYVLDSLKDNQRSEGIVHVIKVHGLDMLSFITDSLALDSSHATSASEMLSFKLVGLESQLRVLHASGLLHTEHLNVFVAEIDSALRSAKSYGWTTAVSKRDTRESPRKALIRSNEIPKAIPMVEKTHEDRRSRILSVLKAQPGVSIKDIVDTVKDCSEKTVQRELNSLIKDGLIVREGERRWSKYSVL